MLVLALALAFRWETPVVPAAALLAAAFVGGTFDDRVDRLAPAAAAGLLVVCELAFWSVELGGPARPEAGHAARHGVWLAVLAAASTLVAALVLEAASVPLDGGVGPTVAGALAAVAAIALVLRLTRADR